MIQAGHVYVLRDQGCVCALDFRGECGGDVQTCTRARPAAAEARVAGRAPRRPRTGRRARDRPGPRLTLRDWRAPYYKEVYNVTMNGYSGGHRRRRADIRPGDGGGELSGRNNNKRSLGKREKYVEKICRENMPPAPGRSRTWRRAGAPRAGRRAGGGPPPPDPGRTQAPRFTRPVVVRCAPSDRG